MKRDRNKEYQTRQDIKMAIRRLLPNWFLGLIRRRQVSLQKMLGFLNEPRVLPPEKEVFNSLAVVLPCYGHARYLPLAFESIIRQTRPPEEVIIIDDRSPDNTAEVIGQLISEYKQSGANQIKFIVQTNNKNLGQCASINKAVELSESDLVMIMNDDDYLMEDAVETMFDLFQKNPQIALIGGSNVGFTEDNILLKKPKKIKDYPGGDPVKLAITTPKDALAFEDYCSLNMTHSSSTFVRIKGVAAGLYRPKKDRLVPFSDRDFQIRINLLYSVGTNVLVPFCFWRSDSSVDSGRYS
ncbi:MAG: glycosyltransferase family A protein [Candidatus Vogelbacteria bacterium]|nr:glycosyltransferase family A protein [Candidatus Vogelbacteria bacterium]